MDRFACGALDAAQRPRCAFQLTVSSAASSFSSGAEPQLEVFEIERHFGLVRPIKPAEIFVGMLGFSFSECHASAGDLIG